MLELYGYWRSSAAYRVRIALALKGLAYRNHSVHLVRNGGEQYSPEYLALNPQGRIPLLVDGERRITQSMAILEYLEWRHPEVPLLPADPLLRVRIQSFCQTIAADIHPLGNVGVLSRLGRLGVGEAEREAWARHWIERGLTALEAETADLPGESTGDPTRGDRDVPAVFGGAFTWADCLLVPQVYNVERFHCDTSGYPRLYALALRSRQHPAFAAAHPAVQPDAPV